MDSVPVGYEVDEKDNKVLNDYRDKQDKRVARSLGNDGEDERSALFHIHEHLAVLFEETLHVGSGGDMRG
eukprot:2519350-Ditylum_brightwellii.AAC.1